MTTTVALITGANKGIGYETAKQLSKLGMTVLIGARDEQRGREAERVLRDGGAEARFVHLDVTDEASIQAAATWIDTEYGHLDVLVNNAGTATLTRQRTLPSETSLEDMRAVYAINVFGLVAVTNAMLPLLRRASAARIVNVSSEVGSIGSQTNPGSPLFPMPASAQYPSSKTAVNMLTVMYAKELQGTAIKVNAANPGFTATDFNDHRGLRTAAQGAEPSVHLATLPEAGPSGILWGHIWTTDGDGDGGYGPLPW
ncbi:SDR family oxidoreductase [Subtercola vilae]|uniref:SDR family oxidoreductase n=1 Tax=Subtercola vilae TaxID=2056433 RepID=A0A4T2BC27_9MICO|nr:SDR family oxidoreductase [Subtercola vilae]TIH28617.1 SDR family oxidoreductase [Subtercola vilae]